MSQFSIESQGNNSFLVYSLKLEETVDTFSSGMLTNNKIKGILPYSYSVLDEARYFKYNITSKTTLKQFFSGVVNRKRLLDVLLSMTQTLLTLDDYMLLQQSVVIDANRIYVDISANHVWLIYLPLLGEISPQPTLNEFVKQLIFSLQYDQTENGDYVAKLMNFVNASKEFSLVEFETFLRGLLNTNQASEHTVRETAATIETSNPLAAPTPQQPQPSVQPTPTQLPPQPQVSAPPVQMNSNAAQPPVRQQNSSVQPQVPPNVPPVPSSKGFSIPGMPAKPAQPAKEAKPAKEPKAAKEKEQKKGFLSSLFGKKDKGQPAGNQPPIVQPPQVPTPPPQPNRMPPQPIMAPPQPTKQQPTPYAHSAMPIANQAGETSVLGIGNNGETTVLGGAQASTPFLVRMKSGQKMFVDKPVFRIGKERSYVDFFIGDNTAISRSHADIITKNGEYFILDNNSTNHTYVDGIMIPSQQEIKIAHGARIKLANEEFEFKLF